MREIRTALNGLGSVNKNLMKILVNKEERLAEDYGLSFKIVTVADSSGVATNSDGFDGIELCAHKDSGHRE
jgi:homoserine dehydrogenase